MAGDGSIGRDLERIRLEHRARHVTLVMATLERRREARLDRGAPVPAALTEAIGGLASELLALDARLKELDPPLRRDRERSAAAPR